MVAVLLLLLFWLPDSWKLHFVFVRSDIEAGEWWRIITGQWMHWRFSHLAFNIAGIAMIWFLFAEHAPTRRYLLLLAVTTIGCMLGTYLFADSITQYVGFSGALYGMFAWGAVRDIRAKRYLAWLLLAIILGKVSFDYFVGPMSLGSTNADVLATPTHFFGVLSGIALALIQRTPSVHKHPAS
ncbi:MULTISPECIES: rhombosortase [Gammaproteobacteria]|uniref:rhombosortase n=1 Tax=Gammaproteobacteria TaxID=1236 RepID=UPI000DD044B0|nr:MULTISPECIES: rhombosortase [Gammaproteobacteria]RTE87494.1 rhombosortase [Aliidiomarina sp. B3213]